jgi:hypothetical protein
VDETAAGGAAEASPGDPSPGPAASPLGGPAAVAALNRQASVLQNLFFPSQVLASLAGGDKASATALRLFLARFQQEAGSPQDPVEQLLLDQLVAAHLKVGELYALAATAAKLEFKQLYANGAVRLLGAVCQLVSTLATYRSSAGKRRRRTKAGRPSPAAAAATKAGGENPRSQVASGGTEGR